MRHGIHSAGQRVTCLAAVCLIALASCGGSHWVQIIGANADSPNATVVTVGLGICVANPASIPQPSVIESSTEVHVRVAVKQDDGDEASCASLQAIKLASPIGDRVVVDDRTGQRFTVQIPS
ncbi:MAG: hypothetical protein RLZZ623_1006 [Actinomycetota bacterium]